MAKIEYIKKRFNGRSLQHIDIANAIIEEYQKDGLRLTLRQLYYQFITRNVFPNSEKSYKNLGQLISDARLAGKVDWDAIADRIRGLRGVHFWDGPADAIRERADKYKEDLWEGQPKHLEVWVEKDALADVISRAATPFRVDFFVCRGYTSQTSLHEAAKRLNYYTGQDKENIVLHLGDHDPSGKDMTRDIVDRFEVFGAEVEIKRLALNMDQVRKYNPPPNPAKVTDSRFEGYRREFGKNSWELDALEPRVIVKLIQDNIKKHIDQKKWAAAEKREEASIKEMKSIADRLEDDE